MSLPARASWASASFQASGTHQFLTCGDEKAPRLHHEQDNGIFWTLTQACQVAYPPQAEVNELPSETAPFARAPRQFDQHSLRFPRTALELDIRRCIWIDELQVVGEHAEQIRRVLRPARQTQVNFGHAPVPIGAQKACQLLLQCRRQGSFVVCLRQLLWSPLAEQGDDCRLFS